MRILITGTGKNLGTFLANRYAQEGHSVFGVSRRERPDELDTSVQYIRADLSEPGVGEALVAEVRPELLIANAIRYSPKPLSSLSLADLQSSFMVNAFVPFLMAQSLLRLGGTATALMLNSDSAFQGSQDYADYTASKSALLNLSRSLAQSARGTSVAIATLVIGPLATPERLAEIARLKQIHGAKAAHLESRALAKNYPWSTQTDFVAMENVHQVLKNLTALGAGANGLVWRLDAGCVPTAG